MFKNTTQLVLTQAEIAVEGSGLLAPQTIDIRYFLKVTYCKNVSTHSGWFNKPVSQIRPNLSKYCFKWRSINNRLILKTQIL